MKILDATSRDGFKLTVGMFVRIDPQAFDKPWHMSARVIQPGPERSLVQPSNHKKSEWCENRYLSVHKSKCRQRNVVLLTEPKPEVSMNKPALRIANSYTPDEAVDPAHVDEPREPPAAKQPAPPEDFDALANMIERLRASAHTKLMRLAEDQRTAKAMLTEADQKITAHLNQCRALGIDMGETKVASVK